MLTAGKLQEYREILRKGGSFDPKIREAPCERGGPGCFSRREGRPVLHLGGCPPVFLARLFPAA
jgi:hypothetical protein